MYLSVVRPNYPSAQRNQRKSKHLPVFGTFGGVLFHFRIIVEVMFVLLLANAIGRGRFSCLPGM